MAELNYDEVTHAVYPAEFDDDLCRFETRFPERLSRLSVGDIDFYSFCRHGDKGRRNKSSARYRTQPITFDEIAEVDEDLVPASHQQQHKSNNSFIDSLKQQQQQQQQDCETIDEQSAEQQVHTGSDKENNPFSETSSFFDLTRQRRRRQSFRKLRNRHSVPEEITEKSEDVECTTWLLWRSCPRHRSINQLQRDCFYKCSAFQSIEDFARTGFRTLDVQISTADCQQ